MARGGLGRGDAQRGFTLAVAVYGLAAAVFFYVTFATCRERLAPPKAEHTSLGADARALARNVPWLVMIALSVLTILWISVRGTATVYYFKYLSGDEKAAGLFLGVGSFAQIAGALTSRRVAMWFGSKKAAFLALNLVAAVFLALFYFIDPRDQPLILAHQIVSSFLAAPLMPLFWSMIADTADYGSWKLGHRSTGLLFSAGTLSQKIGWSVGPAFGGLLLAWFGYAANMEQTETTRESLRLMMSWIPAGLAVVAGLAVLAYPIGRRTEEAMQSAMAGRPS